MRHRRTSMCHRRGLFVVGGDYIHRSNCLSCEANLVPSKALYCVRCIYAVEDDYVL